MVRYEAENATIVAGRVCPTRTRASRGTGFVDYINVAGGYVEWTVTAETAGPATLTFRYANGTTANRPMDITVNGTVVADERRSRHRRAGDLGQHDRSPPPSTPAQHHPGHRHQRANGGPNVDYLEARHRRRPPPGDLQAENATIVQGIAESVHAGFTGTGYVNYNNVAGSYVSGRSAGAGSGPVR